MEELIKKISPYNLFNYLLPGVVFIFLMEKFLSIGIIQGNLLIDAFICYFIGLTISRFGSLVIEPFLRKIKFLKFADYKDFLEASKKDPKIDIFSQENNSYRTYCSLFFLLFTLKIIKTFIPISMDSSFYVLVVLFFILFLCAYKKQTNYIVKKVNFYKNIQK